MGEVIAFQARGNNPEVQLPLAVGAEFDGFYSPFLPVPEESSAEVIELFRQEEPAPAALLVSEIIPEIEVQKIVASFIGSVTLSENIELEEASPEFSYSLSDAINKAASGDKIARNMVEQNVASDVVERTLKSGHITKVELSVKDDDTIIQYGQTDKEIHQNSLRYGSSTQVMKNRAKAETQNMFRRKEVYKMGLFDEYFEVVFSPAPTDMSNDELLGEGFFTDTMSCAIQATTNDNEGLILESAFVAGKKTHNEERHDLAAIYKLGEKLGVDFHGMNATEILETPVLVPKKLMPNGVVDIVRLYDECAGGTFFGEDKPEQDYIQYKEECYKREEAFSPRVKSITARLIAEADKLHDPVKASKRLNDLSAEEMIEHAVVDAVIDPRVFGVESACRVEHARALASAGQYEQMQVVLQQAKALDRSSSCPGGPGDGSKKNLDAPNDSESDSYSSEELEDCEFVSKECPICHEKNVRTVVKKGKYYGDCGCSA